MPFHLSSHPLVWDSANAPRNFQLRWILTLAEDTGNPRFDPRTARRFDWWTVWQLLWVQLSRNNLPEDPTRDLQLLRPRIRRLVSNYWRLLWEFLFHGSWVEKCQKSLFTKQWMRRIPYLLLMSTLETSCLLPQILKNWPWSKRCTLSKASSCGMYEWNW